MKRALSIFSLVALLACTALATSRVAPQQHVALTDDDFFGGSRDTVWTGRTFDANKKLVDVPLSPTFAVDLRKELAAIQVTIDVDRKLDEADKELEELAIRATRRGYEGRKDVLVDITLARVSLFEKLGQIDRANDVTKGDLAHRIDSTFLRKYELVAPTDADRADAAVVARDPRLVALRGRLSKQVSRTKSTASDDKIAKVVHDALTRGDATPIHDLGQRAVTVLEADIAADFDELPAAQFDPLVIMVELAELRAADFILVNFDRGGEIWKRRILRAMTPMNDWVLERPGTWLFGADESASPTMTKPQWMLVLSRLLRESTTASGAMAQVRALVQHDALSLEMQRTMTAALLGDDADVVQAALQALSKSPARATVLPVLEAALASKHADVRTFVAGMLVNYKHSDALVSAVDHTDPVVRRSLASALRGRNIYFPLFQSNGVVAQGQNFYYPDIGVRERAALERLAADANADVRMEAALSIAMLSAPLAQETYVRMAHDPDARVRASILPSHALPDSILVQAAETAAADTSADVVRSLDTFLNKSAQESTLGTGRKSLDPFLTALHTRRGNKSLPIRTGLSFDQLTSVYHLAASSPLGLATLARWAVEDGDVDLGRAVITMMSNRIDPNDGRRMRAKEFGIDVDPHTLAQLFVQANTKPGQGTEFTLQSVLVRLTDDLSSEMLTIADDAHQNMPARLRALELCVEHGGERAGDMCVKLAVDPYWTGNPITAETEGDRIGALGGQMPDPVAAKTLAHLAAEPKTSEAFAVWFGRGFSWNKVITPDLADAVLTRWLEARDGPLDLVEGALNQVASRPRAQQGDWLVRAIHDAPRHSPHVINLLGATRDPSYFDLLSACLEPTSHNYYALRDNALNALTRYFDDRAADVILTAAGSASDQAFRKKCFDALDTIRKYQDEKHRWDTRKTSQQAKDDAVREIIKLLDDGDASVRAQSARSLATLGAIEQLPRIVLMLKDKDAGVRKAAQEALDLLNAPPAQAAPSVKSDEHPKKD